MGDLGGVEVAHHFAIRASGAEKGAWLEAG